jgi:hypothetical protein
MNAAALPQKGRDCLINSLTAETTQDQLYASPLPKKAKFIALPSYF